MLTWFGCLLAMAGFTASLATAHTRRRELWAATHATPDGPATLDELVPSRAWTGPSMLARDGSWSMLD